MTDFPKKEDLLTYGVDVPVPATKAGLVCEYREDEENPVILAELEGYKVPPTGLTFVARSGSGYGPTLIYGNGTFRENKYGIGQPLGATQNEVQIARANAKNQAIEEGIREALEEHGISLQPQAGMLGNLKELAKHVTKNILKDDAPVREQRMWFNDLVKIDANQEDIKDKRESLQAWLNEKGMDAIDMILEQTAQERKRLTSSIDVPFVNVDEVEEDGDDED